MQTQRHADGRVGPLRSEIQLRTKQIGRGSLTGVRLSRHDLEEVLHRRCGLGERAREGREKRRDLARRADGVRRRDQFVRMIRSVVFRCVVVVMRGGVGCLGLVGFRVLRVEVEGVKLIQHVAGEARPDGEAGGKVAARPRHRRRVRDSRILCQPSVRIFRRVTESRGKNEKG